MFWRRLALIRFVPFSYFWTCWNVFLDLLECQANGIAEFLLAHAEHQPAHPHTSANVLVGGLRRSLRHYDLQALESTKIHMHAGMVLLSNIERAGRCIKCR